MPWNDGAEESVEGDYVEGPGAALAVTNSGEDPIRVVFSLSTAAGRDLGEREVVIEPGATSEVRFVIPRHGQHVARFFYNWDARGEAASGGDTQQFDSSQCPDLTRFAWNLVQQADTVGYQYRGKECALPE